jgi:hypothetical protein
MVAVFKLDSVLKVLAYILSWLKFEISINILQLGNISNQERHFLPI